MSDVIWAAIVAVGGSLLTGVIASITTYPISRHQSEVTLATVGEQTSIELAKLGGENERLRAQHREEQRRQAHHQPLPLREAQRRVGQAEVSGGARPGPAALRLLDRRLAAVRRSEAAALS
jgi:hypothetical protein